MRIPIKAGKARVQTRTFPIVDVETQPSAVRNRVRQWITAYESSRLARSLNVSRRQIHLWTQKTNPDIPSLANVRRMIALSTIEPLSIGPLTYEDFFGPVKVVRHSYESYEHTHIHAPRFVPLRRPL